MVAKDESRKTLNETVWEALRADVLAGRLQPGSRVKVADVAARFGVSLSVVREALTRLAEQGLLVSRPQVGFQVVEISVVDLRELTQARTEVEGLVFRYAIAEGSLAWEAELVASHHTLAHLHPDASMGPVETTDAWREAHRAFHYTLLAGCGNKRLLDIAANLRDAAELYQRASLTFGHDPGRDIPAEHQALLDAALNREADLAVALLTQHITRTTDALIASLEQIERDGQDGRDEPALV
jgi:DNA-binding GntR family transcriptional regulator